MGQLEKLISFLTDDGFAVLRTPMASCSTSCRSRARPAAGSVEGSAATEMPAVEMDSRRKKKEKVSHKKRRATAGGVV